MNILLLGAVVPLCSIVMMASGSGGPPSGPVTPLLATVVVNNNTDFTMTTITTSPSQLGVSSTCNGDTEHRSGIPPNPLKCYWAASAAGGTVYVTVKLGAVSCGTLRFGKIGQFNSLPGHPIFTGEASLSAPDGWDKRCVVADGHHPEAPPYDLTPDNLNALDVRYGQGDIWLSLTTDP